MIPTNFLNSRVLIVPGSLARSPGHVSEHFDTSTAAVASVRRFLDRLPPGLVERWEKGPGGYVVLNTDRHGFVLGENSFRGRTLADVAWLKLSIYPNLLPWLDPVGGLLAHLIGWGQRKAETQQAGWAQFVNGVESSFRAGYGLSAGAQTDVGAYLAEGIAHWLADRRGLNARDPRLEKLLTATVFDERFYMV